jgi:hypothetical protein
MQHDTRQGRTDRRTYLKTLGAGALTTGMVGVAGCLGAEAENRNGSNDGDDNGSATDANETQGSGAKTDAPADAAQSTTADESGVEASADEVQGSKACFDDIYMADTSGFETYSSEDGYTIKHPAAWEVDENHSSGRSVVISEQYGAAIGVSVEPAGGKTVDEFASMYLDSVRNDPNNGETETLKQLCRSEITLSSGQTGEFIQFEMDDDQPGAMKRDGEVLLVVTDETLYRVDSGVSYSGSLETEAVMTSFALGGGN